MYEWCAQAKHDQHKGSKSFSAKRATKSTFDLASSDGRLNGALVQNGGPHLMGAGEGDSVSLYIHHAREDSPSSLQKRVSASPSHSPSAAAAAGISTSSSKVRFHQHPVLEI